jgi:hypothetical protein
MPKSGISVGKPTRGSKREFLVVYDAGMSDIWGRVLARSKAEIRRRFRGLEIYEGRPGWLSEANYDSIPESKRQDIDGPVKEWFKLIER